MSMDAEVNAAIAHVTGQNVVTTSADAASVPVDQDALFRVSGLDRNDAPAKPAVTAPGAAAPGQGAKAEQGKAPPGAGAAADEIDPLDPKLYAADKLKTPEDFDKATKRILDELTKVNDLKRAAHRSHGAAEKRESKLEKREQVVTQREQTAAAYDRAFQSNVADLQSGDADRFLTAMHRLSNVGDPAGFWRTVSLKLASGGTFTPEEKRQAQADPEVQRRIAQLEQTLQGREQAEHTGALEQAKTRNLHAAQQNTATPRVVAYATDPRTSEATRDALAKIMLDAYNKSGRPLTIAQACADLESSLAVHFELSQRADGNANGEKGTTGLGPEAGRAPSQEPPKPDRQLSTIPTQLGSAPIAATRPLSEREQREATVQGLDAIGFFGRIGL